jgi:hypothetical protein
MRYYIETFSDVYEESYQGGEGSHVNSWHESKVYTADTPELALKQCLEYLECENYEVTDEGVFAAKLVDEHNYTASEHEVKIWTEGKRELYSQHVVIFINELKPISI